MKLVKKPLALFLAVLLLLSMTSFSVFAKENDKTIPDGILSQTPGYGEGLYSPNSNTRATNLINRTELPWVCGIRFQHLGHGKQKHTVGGFQPYRAVCVQKIGIQIFLQIGEHRTVFHVVTVDNEIGALDIAPPVKERHSALAVFAVEVSAEIFLRIGRCVHNGITDVCAVDTQPSDTVRICGN